MNLNWQRSSFLKTKEKLIMLGQDDVLDNNPMQTINLIEYPN
jgi:hypothetical protein